MTSVVLVLFITVAIIYGSVVQRRLVKISAQPHKKNFPDVDDKWLVLQSLFSIVFDEHFLIRRNRVRESTYPWFDKSILVMMISSTERQKHLTDHWTGRNTGDCVIL